MIRLSKPLLTCSLILLVAGCLPEKRIVWSPDGTVAAVRTDIGLRFINEDGKVLAPQIDNPAGGVSWFADSKRCAILYGREVKTWGSIASIFDAKKKTEIAAFAKELRKRVLTYEGDWDDFKLDPTDRIPSSLEPAVLLYLRDELGDGLAERLGDKWKDIENMTPNFRLLQVFTLADDKLEPGTVLLQTFGEVAQPKVAKNGKNIAVLMQPGDAQQDFASLHVIPTTGGDARLVAENVAYDYDWSPDSKSLAFIRSSVRDLRESDNVVLGSLTTATVASADGELLNTWEQVQDRAGLLFSSRLSVRWLSDDRLVFSSVEVTLPATSRDMPQEWALFMLDPRMPASITRVLGRDFDKSLETGMPLFALSPDEKRVLLPGPGGRVTLYNFASGEATPLIRDEDAGNKTRSLATWRNNSQICLVTNPKTVEKSTTPGKVLLWENGTTKCLSDSWPEEMTEGWLTKD